MCLSASGRGSGGQSKLLAGTTDSEVLNALADAIIGLQMCAAILRTAVAWPRWHIDYFGLKEMAIPSKGGQSHQNCVCPTHSAVHLDLIREPTSPVSIPPQGSIDATRHTA